MIHEVLSVLGAARAVCSLVVEPELTGSGTGSWKRWDQVGSSRPFVSECILMRRGEGEEGEGDKSS